MILQNGLFVTNSGNGPLNGNDSAPQSQTPTPFQIIQSPSGEILFEATALNDLTYQNDVKVAYEPQENGVFYSNSKQGTPFVLHVTCIVTPMLSTVDSTLEDVSTLVLDAKYDLQDILQSNDIVIVITNDYYYDNMTLKSIEYYQSPQTPMLLAELVFQQVRLGNVSFQPLKPDNVSNQTNASQKQSGQVQTQPPGVNAVTQAPNNLNPVGTINNNGSLNLG